MAESVPGKCLVSTQAVLTAGIFLQKPLLATVSFTVCGRADSHPLEPLSGWLISPARGCPPGVLEVQEVTITCWERLGVAGGSWGQLGAYWMPLGLQTSLALQL